MKTKTVNVEFNLVVPESWDNHTIVSALKSTINSQLYRIINERRAWVYGVIEVATNNKWRIALESLTPQGSEYHNDLPRCMEAIQHKLTLGHEAMKECARLRKEVDKRRKVI